MNRYTIAIFAAAITLAGCTTPQGQQAIVQGQLYCAEATATGPLIVALANASGVPVTVINKTAAEVAAACALINAIPVVPPPTPAQAPVVAVKTG